MGKNTYLTVTDQFCGAGGSTAAALASVDYRDDSMKVRRLYTAWDNRKDEARLFAGLEALVRHGVKPDHLMVYILVGYWPDETHEDRDHRRRLLREFGARPYPMPYVRTRELVGFQRWVIGAYDKRVPWTAWVAAGYQPVRLGSRDPARPRICPGGQNRVRVGGNVIEQERRAFEATVSNRVSRLPVEARLALVEMLGDLRSFALEAAGESHRRAKWMMFAYWKVVGTYAGHFRRLVKRSIR